MTITAKIARAKANEVNKNTEAIRYIYAESLIDNFIEPIILEAITEGKTEATISKGLLEDLHENVVAYIYKILNENGYKIFENFDCIRLAW